MSAKSARTIFSENLQRLMRNKNVDQKELAETIGVTQPTISN
ncbi:helix-turn-helix domain-containing protein [Staphylococcus caprae]